MTSGRLSWDRERPDVALDRYGRDAARCRADAEAAAALAEATRGVVAAIEAGEIILGREAGPKLVARFVLNAEQLGAIAERDLEHAAELERAESEDRDKRAANDAVRAERLRRALARSADAPAVEPVEPVIDAPAVVEREAAVCVADAPPARPLRRPLFEVLATWVDNVGWLDTWLGVEREIADRERSRGETLAADDRARLEELWRDRRPTDGGGAS